MEKTKVGILFGGKSEEHEVSLQSAKNIVEAINKEKYEILLIGMDKEGSFYLYQELDFLLNSDSAKDIKLNESEAQLAVIPGDGPGQLLNLNDYQFIRDLDVIFPVLHGPYGEDGTIQGLLKLMDVPFVGAGVLGSAVGMDKDVMKRLLRDAGLPIADFLTYQKNYKIDFAKAKAKLGLPLFIKPANLGSSVGVNMAENEAEFKTAVTEAFKHDTKIIVEEYVVGREIECSVLGNRYPIASKPGEVLPKEGFYSYEAKYIDEDGAQLEIPAKLEEKMIKKIQEIAIESFVVLCCSGLARVDVFLTEDNEIIVNEINTLPGFTKISMYPKLWEASGIAYSDLIDRLIQLALE